MKPETLAAKSTHEHNFYFIDTLYYIERMNKMVRLFCRGQSKSVINESLYFMKSDPSKQVFRNKASVIAVSHFTVYSLSAVQCTEVSEN